jgi:hypothetical protein
MFTQQYKVGKTDKGPLKIHLNGATHKGIKMQSQASNKGVRKMHSIFVTGVNSLSRPTN